MLPRIVSEAAVGAGAGAPGYEAGRVTALFDALAPTYAHRQAWLSAGMSDGWRRWAVRQLQLRPGAEVVDLMCGTGELWPHLAPRLGPDGCLTGVDASGAMLARAAGRMGSMMPPGRGRLVQADALATPLPAGFADAVVCSFGLKTLAPARWPALVAEARRLLRPAGRLVLVDLLPAPGSPTAWLVRQWLCGALGLLAGGSAAPHAALLGYVTRDGADRQRALTQLAATGCRICRLPGGGVGIVGSGR